MPKVEQLIVEINAKTDKLSQGMNKAQNQVSDFGRTVNKLGTAIAGAFAISKIAAFTLEVSQLAGEAEGVEKAFYRVADAATLERLRQATRNTVSDLELMKRTVSASNLGLPVQSLSTLFEFASRRAQETGESVDYLVNSIVTGIGRKSTMILDNLGISATRLKDELGGAGLEATSTFDMAAAVSRIARQELEKMGDATITTKDQTDQLKTSWDNLKVAIGDTVNASIRGLGGLAGALGKVASWLSLVNKVRENWGLNFVQSMMAIAMNGDEIKESFDKIQESVSNLQNDGTPQINKVSGAINILESEISGLKDKIGSASENELPRLNEKLKELEERLKRLKDYTGPVAKNIKAAPGAISNEIGLPTISSEQLSGITNKYYEALEAAKNKTIELNDATKDLISSSLVMWATGVDGADSYAEAMRESSKSVIKGLIARGLTGVIASTLENIPFPFSIGAAIAASAAAGALMHGVSKFAKGGLVTGPTLAMVGDNQSGKEAIIPFERMGEFLRGLGGQPTFIVRNDITAGKFVTFIEQGNKYHSLTH